MAGALETIALAAVRLARQLPASLVEVVAPRLARADDRDARSLRRLIAQTLPSAHHRAAAVAFLDTWMSLSPEIHAQSAAASLVTAALAERDHRDGQAIELVWTGPESGASPIRRTEQAILQVIDSASVRILVVSYAVYNVPQIAEALVRAAARSVRITVIVETSGRTEGQKTYSTLAALGPSVAGCCEVFLWPIEARFKGGAGKPGLLHVKCVAADGRWLFLSSANLTEYAFSINMELGLLITGGTAPAQVEGHFGKLIEMGTLVKA
jgi:phosphatidylserine/phosphatidylglycerophosphate/cardiolipin synthase-like enzyme